METFVILVALDQHFRYKECLAPALAKKTVEKSEAVVAAERVAVAYGCE